MLEASESKTTRRPSLPIPPGRLLPLAGLPSRAIDTSFVVLFSRSRTNTSVKPLESPATRLVAAEAKVTWRPNVDSLEAPLFALACRNGVPTDTRAVNGVAAIAIPAGDANTTPQQTTAMPSNLIEPRVPMTSMIGPPTGSSQDGQYAEASQLGTP